MHYSSKKRTGLAVARFGLMAGLLAAGALGSVTAEAGVGLGDDPLRVAVLPYYTEDGRSVRAGADVRGHYRRIQRTVNNQLVRHGFEVINPFAMEHAEQQYDADMERARQDSALAARTLTRRYGADLVYLVDLRVTRSRIDNGRLCRVRARVEGEAYDSAARDLGVGWEDSVTVTREHCDDAVVDAETVVADTVARTLTAWSGGDTGGVAADGRVGIDVDPRADEVLVDRGYAGPDQCLASGQGGALRRAGEALANLVSVRLDSAVSHEQVEIFGKVLNTVRGVNTAKVYRVDLDPRNPQASQTLWRASIGCTDTFRLAANVSTMLRQVVAAGGRLELNGVVYDYSPAEVDLIKGIRMGQVSSREIQFVLDNRAARRKEMWGGYDGHGSHGGALRLAHRPAPAGIPAGDAGFD